MPRTPYVMTAAVHVAMVEVADQFVPFLASCITRHEEGDWGDVDQQDRIANDRARRTGEGRELSAYKLPPTMAKHEALLDDALWIITEADRSVSTVLWPSDY